MPVNVSAANWTATLEVLDSDSQVVGGPYTYSSAGLDIEISFPEIRTSRSINTTLTWTAQLTLLHGIAAFSTDSRDTAASPTGASLLAIGNRIIITLNGQRPWPPFYILRTPDPKDLAGNPITLQLGDLMLLANAQQSLTETPPITPENDYSGISWGESTTPHGLIRNIATLNDITWSSDTISTGYNLSAPVPKNNTQDWPTFIGEIAACNGYVAWLDSNEELRLTQIDVFDRAAPDIELTIGRDEVGPDGWVPQNFEERAPENLKVIGGGGKAVEIENPLVITNVVPADGYTSLSSVETKTISDVAGNPATTITYVESQAELQIRPLIAETSNFDGLIVVDSYTDNTSTSLRASTTRTITHEFNGITKALQRTTIVERKARGIAGGDAYRDTEGNAALTLIDTEITTVGYEYSRITGRITKITEETKKPYCLFRWGKARPAFYELNRFLVRTCYSRVSEWAEVTSLFGDRQTEEWQHTQTTERSRGIVYPNYEGSAPETLVKVPLRPGQAPQQAESFKITKSDGTTEPPKTIYQESVYKRNETLYDGQVRITPLAGNAHKLVNETIRVAAPVIVSGRQCELTAELYAKWQHGLSLGYSFVGAPPSDILSNFSPIKRVDVTWQSITKAYFLNGLTIGADLDSTLFGCNLGEVGTVGVTPDLITPPALVQRFAIAVSGDIDGGVMLSGPPDVALVVGGDIDGGVMLSGIAGATLVGGDVDGGTMESPPTSSASLVGGDLDGGALATPQSSFFLIGGDLDGGVLVSGPPEFAVLVGGDLDGGVLTSGDDEDMALIGSPVSITTTTTTISFSSIPQTYTHLQLRLLLRSDHSGTDAGIIALNSDTTNANYLRQHIQGSSTTESGASANDRSFAQRLCITTSPTDVFADVIIDLSYYSNTTRNKNLYIRYSAPQTGVTGAVGVQGLTWFNNNAITSIDLTSENGDWVAGCYAELWGR